MVRIAPQTQYLKIYSTGIIALKCSSRALYRTHYKQETRVKKSVTQLVFNYNVPLKYDATACLNTTEQTRRV